MKDKLVTVLECLLKLGDEINRQHTNTQHKHNPSHLQTLQQFHLINSYSPGNAANLDFTQKTAQP